MKTVTFDESKYKLIPLKVDVTGAAFLDTFNCLATAHAFSEMKLNEYLDAVPEVVGFPSETVTYTLSVYRSEDYESYDAALKAGGVTHDKLPQIDVADIPKLMAIIADIYSWGRGESLGFRVTHPMGKILSQSKYSLTTEDKAFIKAAGNTGADVRTAEEWIILYMKDDVDAADSLDCGCVIHDLYEIWRAARNFAMGKLK